MADEFLTREYTPAEVLVMVAATRFRGFTQNDWYAWAGCESSDPRIGEFSHEDGSGRTTTIVVDGEDLNLLDCTATESDGFGGRLYRLGALS